VSPSVFSQVKRLARHSSIYGVGNILTRLIGFLLLPIYTNYLPPTAFGVAALIFTFLAIMNVFYSYGMDVAFLRYYVPEDNPVRRKEIFGLAFISLLISSALFSLAIFGASSRISYMIFGHQEYTELIQLASAILILDCLTILPFLYLRANERSVIYISFKFFNVMVSLTANILFIVKWGWGVRGIFWANTLASGLTLLALSPIILQNLRWRFQPALYRELLKFGLPYVPSGLAVILMDLIDRFILQRLTNLEVVGIYSAGYKLGMFMALFVAAFRFAWHPFFLSVAKESHAKQVFARVLTYFVLACSFVFLALSFLIEDIVRLRFFGLTLFGEAYWQSTVIVPVILLSYLVYGVYVNFVVGIYLEKKTGYLPFITGAGALTNIGLNLVFIPLWGMMGAAWATLAAYVIMAIANYRLSQRYYPIAYEWGRIFKIALATALIFAVGKLHLLSLPQTLLSSLLLAIFVGLLLLMGFLTTDEKQKIRQAFSLIRS